MRNILSISKYISLVLIFMIACGPAMQRSGVEKDERTEAEGRFDPLGFPGDDAVITGKSKQITPSEQPEIAEDIQVELDEPEQLEEIALGPDTSHQMVVFRVQVFASKDFDEAQQFASDIQSMFPEGVFVEYQMPYYKVRVGEFYSPEEGEVFLDEVKQIGFKNAWLVRVLQ